MLAEVGRAPPRVVLHWRNAVRVSPAGCRAQPILARRRYELSALRVASALRPSGGPPRALFGVGWPRPIGCAGEQISAFSPRVAQETICRECRLPGEGARLSASLSRDAQGREAGAPAAQMGERSGVPRTTTHTQPGKAAQEALPKGLWDVRGRLRRDAAAAAWRLCHLWEIQPGALRRSLPCVRQGARSALRQVQQRARVLQRRPRASAGGNLVFAGRA
jgi:hypothetical protein